MIARRLWLSTALLLLAPAISLGADDPYGDPLPEGAKARMGTARLRNQSYTTPLLMPDGKALLSSGPNGLVRIDPATGAQIGKIDVQFFGTPAALSADGKRAVHPMFDRTVVWELETGKQIAKIERRVPSTEAGVSLSADGNVLAFGGFGDRQKKTSATVTIWDVAADKELKTITAPQNDYVNVALSADGKTVASWGYHYDPDAKAPPDPETNLSRMVHFWDAATGKELAKYRVGGYSAQAVAFAPNGVVAVAGGNSTIDLVDPKTGQSKTLLLGRSRMGRMITFSADGSVVASTSDDGAVQMWKVADGARIATTEPPTTNLYNVRVRLLGNDKGIAWATKGVATLVWEVPSGKLISPAGGHTSMVRGVAVLQDGKHVLTSADDGVALKWELATGKNVGSVAFRQPSNFGYSYQPAATFSPDGSKALIRDSAGGVGVHDVATGAQQYVIPTPFDGTSNGTFSADGTKVVVTTSSFDFKKTPARATAWDASTAKRLGGIELAGYSSVSAAVTPDGKHLITAGAKPKADGNGSDFVIAAWDLATGAKAGEYTEATGFMTAYVTAAPDSKHALVVTSGGKLVSFNLASGKVVKTFETDRRAPGSAPVFTPDGKKFAVATATGFGANPTSAVLVIDWESGDTKQTFNSPGQTPQALAFSHDGKYLVTGSPDTTATVWEVK